MYLIIKVVNNNYIHLVLHEINKQSTEMAMNGGPSICNLDWDYIIQRMDHLLGSCDVSRKGNG